MDKLTSKIKAKEGLTIKQFCTKILDTDYKAFRYRMRVEKLSLTEIRLILIYTGLTFEDIFTTKEPVLDEPPVKKPPKSNFIETGDFKQK